MNLLRILLVAELEEDALQIRRVFRQGGIEADAKHAATLERVQKAMDGGSWDAIIAVCGTGGFTGTGILEEVRRRGYDLPVLIVSRTAVGDGAFIPLIKILPTLGREEISPASERQSETASNALTAGKIVHDFNNILTAIIGFAEIANLELDEKSPAKQQIAEILKAGERARGLVDRILALSC
jgi:signal transduction histidine kinase